MYELMFNSNSIVFLLNIDKKLSIVELERDEL